MAEIHGDYQDRFAGVAETLSRQVDEGLDIGASVAVFVDGESVVDIWTGHQDAARTRPWGRDTIVNDCVRTGSVCEWQPTCAPPGAPGSGGGSTPGSPGSGGGSVTGSPPADDAGVSDAAFDAKEWADAIGI